MPMLTHFVLSTLAAVPVEPVPEEASAAVQSVWDFAVKGGIMMVPIGICSLVALTVVFDRVVHLRRARVCPPALVGALDKTIEGDDGLERAREMCRENGSSMAAVLGAALRRAGQAREVVEHAVQEAADRELLRLRRFLRVLSVIASIAPLLGLLGTIIGMIMAFQTVATNADALGKTAMLAEGIYQAMITTAGGLTVAIPVLISYHWLVARIQQRVIEIDDEVVAFVDRHHLAVDAPTRLVAAPAPQTAPQPAPVTTNGTPPTIEVVPPAVTTAATGGA